MKFIELEMNDYRQFFGRQILTFASGNKENITLINGANGAGKTHLFEAINWCFYGEYTENRGAIVSKEKAVSAKFGDEIECSVSIWYSHDGAEHLATRRGRAKKITIGSARGKQTEEERNPKYKGFKLEMQPAKEEDFKVFRRSESGMKEVSDPTITIDRALPQNARQYFLFDGEKIEQLSKPIHDREVKEAVRNVLQLPSIERASGHLKTVKKDLLATAKKNSKSLNEEDLLRAVEELDSAMERAQKGHKERSERISEVKELRSRIDEDLRKYGSIKELTKRRDDLQRSYQSCGQRIKNLKSASSEILANSHLIMSKELVVESNSFLDARRVKGQIPPGIRETFVKDLIEKGRCICGNSLTEGSEGRSCIESFMAESKNNTRIAEQLSEIIADLNQIKQLGIELPARLKRNLSDWMTAISELEDIAGRLEDVHSQIKKVGDADISKLEASRKQCEEDERRLIREQAELESLMRGFNDQIKVLEKELKTITKSKTASGEFMRLSKLAEMSIAVFDTLYEEFAKKKRREIEEKLKNIFPKLIWKKEQFPSVGLTDNYSLELYDKYGSPAREELSSGERQVLSLSFITAMAFVTGGNIPLIMDTPFGRLFKMHRLNIVREIPELTNQWVLLVQDEEINDEMIDIMRPGIGKEYQLVFADGCTAIKEG